MYTTLKKQDHDTLYLFKVGLFYNFLNEDAILISNKLNLKLSNLSPTVLKCGFPYNSLDKYMQILSRTSYNIKIIDISKPNEIFTPNEFKINKNIKELLEEIAKINIDDISIKEAYSLLEIFKDKSKKIIEKGI